MCSNLSINPICIVYNYQGLIAGIMALLSAYFTIKYLKQQIDQTSLIELNRIDRSYDANKSLLPLSLNDISLLYLDASHHIYGAIIMTRSQKDYPALWLHLETSYHATIRRKFSINQYSIDNIKFLIEYSDNDTTTHLTKILINLQSNLARLNGLDKNNGNKINDRETLLTIILAGIVQGQAIIHSTYPFARDLNNISSCPSQYTDNDFSEAFKYLIPNNFLPENLMEKLQSLVKPI